MHEEDDKELENLSNSLRAKLVRMEYGRKKNKKKMFRSDGVLVVDEDRDVDGTRIEGLAVGHRRQVELSADPNVLGLKPGSQEVLDRKIMANVPTTHHTPKLGNCLAGTNIGDRRQQRRPSSSTCSGLRLWDKIRF
ncbi:hypothetical protein B0H14DRAFT_2583848 [Mycena olivaceomarginata]|nr:hypothetical protein B0H14DRAFT_2583848 [Mycena olivaceomarginata]